MAWTSVYISDNCPLFGKFRSKQTVSIWKIESHGQPIGMPWNNLLQISIKTCLVKPCLQTQTLALKAQFHTNEIRFSAYKSLKLDIATEKKSITSMHHVNIWINVWIGNQDRIGELVERTCHVPTLSLVSCTQRHCTGNHFAECKFVGLCLTLKMPHRLKSKSRIRSWVGRTLNKETIIR